MKSRSYILIAVIALLFFLLAFIPAKFAWNLLPETTKSDFPLAVEEVGGTVWDGYVVGTFSSGMLPGPTALSWEFKPLRLLLADLAVAVSAEHSAFDIEGTLRSGLFGGKGVQNLNGEVSADLANQFLEQMGAKVSGVLNLRDLTLAFADEMKVADADGQIEWPGGPVSYNDRGMQQNIEVPALLGNVEQQDGGLRMAVTEQKGQGLLGELTLDGPIGGVVVFKRVMRLVGMGNPEDEDAVLVQLQQPLFL